MLIAEFFFRSHGKCDTLSCCEVVGILTLMGFCACEGEGRVAGVYVAQDFSPIT